MPSAEPAHAPSYPRWRTAAIAALALGVFVLAAAAWWWAAHVPAPTDEPANGDTDPVLAVPVAMRPVHQAHAGSAACAGCHREIHDAWRASQHARAERPLDPDGEDAAALAAIAAAGAVATAGLPPQATTIARVLGEAPLRQLLVPTTGGRVQVTSAAWDPARGEWFDVFADGRRPDEWGHWRGRGMNWNSMCATCHNTGVDKAYDITTDSYATRVAEHGVGCEACHGALGDHAQQARTAAPAMMAATARASAAGALAAARAMSTCGACHARRAELTGRHRPGEAFDDHFLLTFVGDGEAFHPDGQVHEENFEYAAFLGSRMHAAGVGCGDCHDPHSGRLRMEGDALCLRCHAPAARADAPDIDVATHSHHPAGSAGRACVGCHMPLTTYMQRDPRRDHGFTSPDPLLTTTLGIPNACNRCHEGKSAQWALAHATAWYGARLARPARARAQALAAARSGRVDADLPQALVSLARPGAAAVWRASAILLATPWLDAQGPHAPALRALLADALADPDPGVREAATRALGERAAVDANVAELLRPRLADASRAVRISAAWALRAALDPGSRAGQDLQRMLALNADQPAGQLRLGQFHAARGDAGRALGHMRTAIAWDRHSAPLHRDLALLLAQGGDLAAAVTSLSEAVRIAPSVGSFRYELGLLHAELGDIAAATSAFERTVALEPAFARAWYNLGLARAGQQRIEGALAALARAEALAPGPRTPGAGDAAFAAATLHLRKGDTAAARSALGRAIAREPGHAQARALLADIEDRGAR